MPAPTGFCSADFLALNVQNYFRRRPTGTARTQPAPLAPPSPTPARTSVLVNTCNHGPYIEECIESLLVQTVLPDEIIVYDDGSDDDTVARLRRYGNRLILMEGEALPKPGYLRQAQAVQAAFRRSSGQLIFLLDGDDRFKRDKIHHYLAAFGGHPEASLVQAPMDKIDRHGRILGSNVEPRKHIAEHLKEIYRKQDVDFFYPTSALAFSRSYLERVLPLDFSDGCELWIDTRLSMVAPYFGQVITLTDRLTEWRRHEDCDSIRVRTPRLQIQQTLMRTRVFNNFCRRHGLRPISAWRNTRFYLQLLRYALPERMYRVFYEYLRPRLGSYI